MDKFVSIRLQQDEINLLKRVCQARGEGVSDFIRRGIKRELARLSFGSEFQKKCLEINDKDERNPVVIPDANECSEVRAAPK